MFRNAFLFLFAMPAFMLAQVSSTDALPVAEVEYRENRQVKVEHLKPQALAVYEFQWQNERLKMQQFKKVSRTYRNQDTGYRLFYVDTLLVAEWVEDYEKTSLLELDSFLVDTIRDAEDPSIILFVDSLSSVELKYHFAIEAEQSESSEQLTEELSKAFKSWGVESYVVSLVNWAGVHQKHQRLKTSSKKDLKTYLQKHYFPNKPELMLSVQPLQPIGAEEIIFAATN